jgi:ubiquitin C-terminal hydrolase
VRLVGMNGFPNDGNLCWFNAATQILLHVPPLTNYALADVLFEEDLYKKRINACAMASAFAALARTYWKQPVGDGGDPKSLPASLSAFRSSFLKLKKSMSGSKTQHDAHEALLAVIEHLHAALSKPAASAPSSLNDPAAAAAWTAYIRGQGYSLLVDMFAMQTREVIGGKDVYDHRWGASLPLSGGLTSVTQGLQDLQTSVTHAPRILVVHLTRFDASGTKIDRFVNYTLDVDFATKKYELFAVLLHSGSAGDGHYASLVQHRGAWTFANDDAVTPVTNINDVIQKDAYVLVYKCTNYDA